MRLLLILLFCVSIAGWSWGDSLASKNKEGNRLYKEGKIDEALSKWRDAQIENPDSDKLYYNIGNGLHEQKKYEDAFKEYEKSLNPGVGEGFKPAPTKDNEFKANTYYNMGNTHYRMGKLPEAIEDYKKCLDINPKDEDAKYNIEFIKKKLEEQKQKQAEQKEENKEEKSEETKEKKEKQNQAQEQKNVAGGEEKPENQKPEEKSAEEEKKDEMSKEDAIRLLDALKDDENDLQKELRTRPVEGRYRVEKDW
ncbi:MAG: tetratricopeptide repeat protein [Candidatus Omnitrophota bacterium]|nr:tetratricopeptide repeat protein [Candidatus Omnitrophota bacterium]